MKRPRKAPSRTLNRRPACSQLALTLFLFTPALVAFYLLGAPREIPWIVTFAPVQEVADATPTDELGKIFTVIRSARSDISDAEAWRVSEVILEESAKRHLDPMMVLAVIQVESGFQPTAVSPMGARGIMQIMPETGKFLSESLGQEYGFHPASFRPESLDDPLLNIRLGVYYLHDLTKQFKSLNLALLAYNAGPGEIQNRLEKNVTFSEKYATLVFDAYHSFKKSHQPTF